MTKHDNGGPAEEIQHVADIRKRCNNATPGEWEFRSRTENDSDYPFITYYVWSYPYGRSKGPQGICEDIMRADDCEFIAHARDDIQWLLQKLADAMIAEKRKRETKCMD